MESLAPPTSGDLPAPADDEPAADPPSAPTSGSRAERAAEERSFAGAVIVALLAFTVPLSMVMIIWSTPGGELDWTRRIQLAPFDGVLLLAIAWTALNPRYLIDLFRSTSVRIVSGLFVAVYAVALAAHFSALGMALGFRLTAGLCVIAACGAASQTHRGRSVLFGSVAAAGAVQAILGMVQSAQGQTFGVSPVDFDFVLYQFGSSSAAQGGFPHPYHLTGFLVVCQGAALLGLRHARSSRMPWLASLVIISLGISITYSRAGAVGQIALLGCAVLGSRDRRILLPAAAAVAIGLTVGAVAFGDGWVARSNTTAGKTQESADSDRGQRLREAKELFEDDPIIGVGPGRYVEVLSQTPRERYQPAHNLVAHEAVEYGFMGGVLMLAFLALLGLRVLRGGVWTGMVVLPTVPLLLLGSVGYVLATSFAVSAIWLGLVRASLDPVDDDDEASGEADEVDPALQPAS